MPQRLPQFVLTANEVEQVLAQPDLDTLVGIRDRAILETLYSTGVRRSELCRLDLYSIDATRGTLMVQQGKGRRDRVIPIGARALRWVQRYTREVRARWVTEPDCGALFLGHRGEPVDASYLTHLVHGYVERAELGKRGSCHLLRHSMATLMLENGADVRFVQAMLGHVKLETTALYTQVSIKKLQEVHGRTHPGSRLEPPARSESAAGAGGDPERAELLSSLAAERAGENENAEA
jgi:integrase/recombinase XerD